MAEVRNSMMDINDIPPGAVELTVGSGLIELVGPLVTEQIMRATLRAHGRMLELHLSFAMSGAMRWPMGMRPEVLIWTEVTVG